MVVNTARARARAWSLRWRCASSTHALIVQPALTFPAHERHYCIDFWPGRNFLRFFVLVKVLKIVVHFWPCFKLVTLHSARIHTGNYVYVIHNNNNNNNDFQSELLIKAYYNDIWPKKITIYWFTFHMLSKPMFFFRVKEMETLGKILGTDSSLKKVNADLNCLQSIHISFCVSLKKRVRN